MDKDKLENLRAGVAEMRSVAWRLTNWADDIEASFRSQEAATSQMDTGEPAPAEKEEKATAAKAAEGEAPTTAGGGNLVGAEVNRNERAVRGTVAKIEVAGGEQAANETSSPPLPLPEVRKILAEKCAAGFGTQVKALIESYGASSLKEVPPEKYEELLAAVSGLGGDPVA